MMVPSKSLIAGLALAAMGTVGNAQQTGQKIHQIQGIKHISYNLATGEITPGADNEKVIALAANFSNTDTSGFFSGGALDSSVDGGPGNAEVWLDWGIVPLDTGSDLVGEFDFAYATTVTAVNDVDLTVAFYDGATGFCADTANITGGATASFSFSGLPGVTTTTGGTVNNAYIVTVPLNGGFNFCNAGTGNAFGFSIESFDDDGLGFWASGPILCQAGNGTGGPDSNGQVDVFDIYDDQVGSGGTCIGSFFFGGPPSDFSSWFLEMRTAAPDAGGADDWVVVQSNGTGLNPNNFVVTNGLELKGSFVATDQSSIGGLGVFAVGYLSPLVFNLPGFGELLVNVADSGGELLGPAGAAGPYIFDGAGVANIVIPVPGDLALCGIVVFSQTFEFGGGIQLNNANACTIGVAP